MSLGHSGGVLAVCLDGEPSAQSEVPNAPGQLFMKDFAPVAFPSTLTTISRPAIVRVIFERVLAVSNVLPECWSSTVLL